MRQIRKMATGSGSGAVDPISCRQSKYNNILFTKFRSTEYSITFHFIPCLGAGTLSILVARTLVCPCDWLVSARIRCFRVKYCTRCSSQISCRSYLALDWGEYSNSIPFAKRR